jgi:hypothetical protein
MLSWQLKGEGRRGTLDTRHSQSQSESHVTPTFRRYDNTLTSFPRSLFSFLSFRSFKMAASLSSLRINTIFERPLKCFDGNAARHVARQSKWKEQHEKNVRLAI